jgi:hypothetical protein
MYEALVYIQYTNACGICIRECMLVIKMIDKNNKFLKCKENKNVQDKKNKHNIRQTNKG